MNTRNSCLLTASLLAIAILPPFALAGPKNVPFKASLTTHETIVLGSSICSSTSLEGVTTATGNASHLGRVSGLATDCITMILPEPPNSLLSYAFDQGELILTAANGDQLIATYSGTFNPTTNDNLDPRAAIYEIRGKFLVTGGTGRFSNATGEGSLNGLENINTLQGQLELKGAISY